MYGQTNSEFPPLQHEQGLLSAPIGLDQDIGLELNLDDIFKTQFDSDSPRVPALGSPRVTDIYRPMV